MRAKGRAVKKLTRFGSVELRGDVRVLVTSQRYVDGVVSSSTAAAAGSTVSAATGGAIAAGSSTEVFGGVGGCCRATAGVRDVVLRVGGDRRRWAAGVDLRAGRDCLAFAFGLAGGVGMVRRGVEELRSKIEIKKTSKEQAGVHILMRCHEEPQDRWRNNRCGKHADAFLRGRGGGEEGGDDPLRTLSPQATIRRHLGVRRFWRMATIGTTRHRWGSTGMM